MVDGLWVVLKWLPVAVGVSPMVLGIGWGVLEGSILPRLIPREEIERLADDLMEHDPWDPEEAALAEEHAAWCRSERYEQGKWHRIRKVVRRRLRSGGMPAAPLTPPPSSDGPTPPPAGAASGRQST